MNPGRVTGLAGKRGSCYAVVNDILRAGVVVDVDSHPPQSGDFGGEFGEAAVILSASRPEMLTLS